MTAAPLDDATIRDWRHAAARLLMYHPIDDRTRATMRKIVADDDLEAFKSLAVFWYRARLNDVLHAKVWETPVVDAVYDQEDPGL